MDKNKYLEAVLEDQNLADDSEELNELQEHRADVDKLLRAAFPDCSPTIRYAGSKAKGTINREAYDLDIVCYFLCDDDTAGATLQEIYTNVQAKLGTAYYADPRTSAIRLKSKDPTTYGRDFHIDVVPGRFVDDSKADCFLHQEGAEKERLKTNLDVHIRHVRDSGVVPAIRLMKLWKARRALRVRQFVLELLVIDLLKGKQSQSLADQLEHVWRSIKDASSPISIKDPANPEGNDLTPLLTSAWSELTIAAQGTLALIEGSGWEAVFGKVESNEQESGKSEKLVRSAAAVVTPTKPWRSRE